MVLEALLPKVKTGAAAAGAVEVVGVDEDAGAVVLVEVVVPP